MTIPEYLSSSSAIDNMRDTTGFDLFGVAHWVGEYLIKTFVGIMFLVLKYLSVWIIVMAVFASLIYFVVRAFKFYKH